MCNNMLNKAEALHYGQSEHLEPVITVCLGLREGSEFYLHEGSFVQCCPVHTSAARPLCSWNCWQRMLLRCIEWHGRVPADLFGRCSYLKVKLNLGASPAEWKLCSCLRVSCPDSGIGRVCSWSRDSPQVLQWVGGGWRWSPAETARSMCAEPCPQLSLTGPFPFPSTSLLDARSTANGILRRWRWNYRKGVADKWKRELRIVGRNIVCSHTSSAQLSCSTGCYFQQMFVSKIPI